MPTAEPAQLDEVLGERDVVVVRGADAASYLHSQVSQQIDGMGVGERRWSFVLDPTGRIDGLFRVERLAVDRFALDTDRGWGERLAVRLGRFKIRVDVEIELVDIGPVETDLRQGTGGSASDEALRIEIGWPRLGAEIVPGETIPAGTGLVPLTVDFSKGCYPGQELVERMDSRGASSPTTLRRVDVAAGTTVGEPVLDGADEVGVVTSVAGARALAWVKRSSDVGEPVAF